MERVTVALIAQVAAVGILTGWKPEGYEILVSGIHADGNHEEYRSAPSNMTNSKGKKGRGDKRAEGSKLSVHNKQQTEGPTNASKHTQNEETWESPGALRWDGTQGTVTERDVHE